MTKEPFYIQLNQYRVIPRLLVAGHAVLIYQVSDWFMRLPDPTGTQAAFVSTLVGVSGAIFGLYTTTGPRE